MGNTMQDKHDFVVKVSKRKHKRHKHSHSSRGRRSGKYPSSARSGRMRSFDEVETKMMGVLLKILLVVCSVSLIIWAIASIIN